MGITGKRVRQAERVQPKRDERNQRVENGPPPEGSVPLGPHPLEDRNLHEAERRRLREEVPHRPEGRVVLEYRATIQRDHRKAQGGEREDGGRGWRLDLPRPAARHPSRPERRNQGLPLQAGPRPRRRRSRGGYLAVDQKIALDLL